MPKSTDELREFCLSGVRHAQDMYATTLSIHWIGVSDGYLEVLDFINQEEDK